MGFTVLVWEESLNFQMLITVKDAVEGSLPLVISLMAPS
jgi:hypothetical protein